ncbi:MAG: putative nucleotidyltransferase substrate binding domain-containing protein, partial [Rubrivivax sp.]
LQLLRLRWQVADEPPVDAVAAATALAHANRVDVRRLHAIDRRVLKEAFRAARSLQERVAMDIGR